MSDGGAMDFDGLEDVYERLARAIDEAGEAHAPVLLAKLALLLAHELGDVEKVVAAIDRARADVP